MKTVTSQDGTIIAYDEWGSGPAIILVDGALQYRAFDQGMVRLAELLAPHFLVIHYDRRGRGDSTDTLPYRLAREIEDIEALIDELGETAALYGISSGAALAMEAALALPRKVVKLAMYEAPYNSDPTARKAWREYRAALDAALATGRNGEAIGLFVGLLGAPPEALEGMRQMPDWPKWEAVAPTLTYDAAALGEEASLPLGRAAQVAQPALVLDGGGSEWSFMRSTAVALAQAMPHAQHRTLKGQTHEVSAEALAPVLIEFFKDKEDGGLSHDRTE